MLSKWLRLSIRLPIKVSLLKFIWHTVVLKCLHLWLRHIKLLFIRSTCTWSTKRLPLFIFSHILNIKFPFSLFFSLFLFFFKLNCCLHLLQVFIVPSRLFNLLNYRLAVLCKSLLLLKLYRFWLRLRLWNWKKFIKSLVLRLHVHWHFIFIRCTLRTCRLTVSNPLYLLLCRRWYWITLRKRLIVKLWSGLCDWQIIKITVRARNLLHHWLYDLSFDFRFRPYFISFLLNLIPHRSTWFRWLIFRRLNNLLLPLQKVRRWCHLYWLDMLFRSFHLLRGLNGNLHYW